MINVFPIDTSLKDELKTWGMALMNKLLLRYTTIKKEGYKIKTPEKVVEASHEMISRSHDDIDYFINNRIRPNLVFTDNKEDFIQFVFIKDWVKKNTCINENVSPMKLTDALERIFEKQYVKRYRMPKTKQDMNKCLVGVKWVVSDLSQNSV